MTELRISASPDAIAHIQEILRIGRADAHTADLAPALHFVISWTSSKDGRVFEQYTGGNFDVGWWPRDYVIPPNFVEADLAGTNLFVTTDALKMLANKQLVVETVETGFPTPADKTTHVLRAQ